LWAILRLDTGNIAPVNAESTFSFGLLGEPATKSIRQADNL
jgi:hypothetical protein